MATALELYFDGASEARVRAIWAALDAHGVPSLGAAGGAFHPHVSLCVADDVITVTDELRTESRRALGAAIVLAALGFFPNANGAVAFLGVTPTPALLRVHATVDGVLARSGVEPWPLYRPDVWVPHCTLAMHVHHAELVPGVVLAHELPIRATVAGIRVVEVRTGETVATVA
jgi:2'-5' RNA ligase